MPNLSRVTTDSPTDSIPADTEPDVTWGRGGIDDWGWTTDAESNADPDRHA
jgi:hypothetical protein